MALAVREIEERSLATTQATEFETRLVETWLKSNSSIHTRRAYSKAYRLLREYIGYRPLNQVSTLDIEDFKEHMAETVSQSSANTRLAAIKSLFSYLVGVAPDVYRVNPGRMVKPYKTGNGLAERILTEGEVLKIINLEPDKRNHALLWFLYRTGARVSEVCSLTWGQLQATDKGGQATLHGKGSKDRVVCIQKDLWEEIQRLRGNAGANKPVFTSRKKHGHLDASQVTRIVKAAAARAGIDSNVSPHWFRHATASHSLDRGCPIHVVQQTLGHASLATTSRYVHARPGESAGDYLI